MKVSDGVPEMVQAARKLRGRMSLRLALAAVAMPG